MFGRTKAEPRTVLIVDIEGGSVAVGLARRAEDGTLSISNERRVMLPLRPHRSAESLAADTQKLLERLLPEASARSREAGGIDGISVFLAPPWGAPNLAKGSPDFAPHVEALVRRELSPYFEAPASFYTNAGATLGGLRHIAPAEDKYLLAIVTHEMTELLLVYNGAVAGHASMPHGINLPLRTLRAHGGMSEAEARSLLRLSSAGQPAHMREPLSAANEAFASELFTAGRELFAQSDLDAFGAQAPARAWVVSSAGDFFAKSLEHPSLGDLFPQGGTVAALRPAHAGRHVNGARGHDLFVLLESIFVLR